MFPLILIQIANFEKHLQVIRQVVPYHSSSEMVEHYHFEVKVSAILYQLKWTSALGQSGHVTYPCT